MFPCLRTSDSDEWAVNRPAQTWMTSWWSSIHLNQVCCSWRMSQDSGPRGLEFDTPAGGSQKLYSLLDYYFKRGDVQKLFNILNVFLVLRSSLALSHSRVPAAVRQELWLLALGDQEASSDMIQGRSWLSSGLLEDNGRKTDSYSDLGWKFESFLTASWTTALTVHCFRPTNVLLYSFNVA